jgi:type II secretory pathway component PulM
VSLAELKPREKKLLAAGAAALIIFVFFVYSKFGGGPAQGDDDFKKITHTRDAFMDDLASYQAQSGSVDRIDKMLDKTPAGFDLYGAMSAMVDALGIRDKIKNLTQHSGEGGNFYDESYVDVDLKQITLDDLVELLKKVDEQPAFLRVSTLSVKRRFSAEDKTLDVTLRVSAYSRKQPDAAPKPHE